MGFMASLEGMFVATLFIGDAIFPTPEHDANPLEGEGPNRGVMKLSQSASLFIEAARPIREVDGASGLFVKRLAQELRTVPTEVAMTDVLLSRASFLSMEPLQEVQQRFVHPLRLFEHDPVG